MSPALWARVVAHLELSPQHERLVWLLLSGLQHKEAAAAMGISPDTLKTYLNRIGIKLGLKGKHHLIVHVYAMAIALLEQPLKPVD
jgi:DNA-binding CsgD family transcriptional regulator